MCAGQGGGAHRCWSRKDCSLVATVSHVTLSQRRAHTLCVQLPCWHCVPRWSCRHCTACKQSCLAGTACPDAHVGVALRANKAVLSYGPRLASTVCPAALLALCAPMVMSALHCVHPKLPCWHCVPRWSCRRCTACKQSCLAGAVCPDGHVGVALRANKAALLALCAPMVMSASHCVQTKLPC